MIANYTNDAQKIAAGIDHLLSAVTKPAGELLNKVTGVAGEASAAAQASAAEVKSEALGVFAAIEGLGAIGSALLGFGVVGGNHMAAAQTGSLSVASTNAGINKSSGTFLS